MPSKLKEPLYESFKRMKSAERYFERDTNNNQILFLHEKNIPSIKFNNTNGVKELNVEIISSSTTDKALLHKLLLESHSNKKNLSSM